MGIIPGDRKRASQITEETKVEDVVTTIKELDLGRSCYSKT